MSDASSALAYVALGANIDAPDARVSEAMQRLDAAPFGRVMARSSLYRTAPVGKLDQPDFVNAMVALQTPLAPHDLIRALLGLEAQLGRVRGERNGPRRIDLDLIAYDARRIDLPDLQLPHPRAVERAFVMVPWAEIAPDAVIGGARVADLAARLPCHDIARIEA